MIERKHPELTSIEDVQHYYRFGLDDEQIKKFYEWKKDLPVSKAAAGEQFKFSFLPTGLGMVVIVKCCVTGKEINLTDYDSW